MRQRRISVEKKIEKPADNKEKDTDLLEDKIDLVLKVIGRFDFYINSTNAKASLILAWNGVAVGAILLKYDAVLALYQKNSSVQVIAVFLLSLIGAFSVLSIGLVFKVVFPFLKATSKKTPNESILFFGSVASMGAERYFEKLSKETSTEILSDLSDQAVILAQGVRDKMQVMQKSINAIYVQLFLLLGLVVLLTIIQYM